MLKFNKVVRWLPECYFILVFGWMTIYNTNEPRVSVFPTLIVLAVLILQLRLRNRVIAYIFSFLFGFASLYLVLALLSDLMKIKVFDSGAWKFLLLAGGFIIVSFSMSVLMYRNYSKKKLSPASQN